MSMKWMRCLNHILQHVPSEKLTQNPTPTPAYAHPLLEQWYGIALWQYDYYPWLKAFKDFLQVSSESGMSMKWMGGPNHILQLQHVLCENPTIILLAHLSDGIVWCCGNMTASHS
jgi:hypothetical protein